ncbi:unnamed protein product [Ectocarpus sp. 12 AP-2014]
MERVISIKEAAELCDNDDEFLKELIGLMREDLKCCLELLPKAFADNNPVQTKEVAHRIKGQAANLAAKDLFEKSRKVEDAAKTGMCTKSEYLLLILSIQEFLRCTREK